MPQELLSRVGPFEVEATRAGVGGIFAGRVRLLVDGKLVHETERQSGEGAMRRAFGLAKRWAERHQPLFEEKVRCKCQRCGKPLYQFSPGNYRCLPGGSWEGICYGCLTPEED